MLFSPAYFMQANLTEVDVENEIKKQPCIVLERNRFNELPLHIVCEILHIVDTSILFIILEANLSGAREKNIHGCLPLHKAVSAKPTDGIKLRIESLYMVLEAYPDGLRDWDHQGRLPLHVAANYPHGASEVVIGILLDEYSEAARLTDSAGRLPLHLAACKAKTKANVLRCLIAAYPAGCLQGDHTGFLPLHWAVARDDPSWENIAALVESHPETTLMPDSEGRTAIDRLMFRGKIREGEKCLSVLLAAKRQVTDTTSPVITLMQQQL